MRTLAELHRALGGKIDAGRRVLCPGPGHSAQDESLAVRPSATAPEGFTVHSHAGDDWKVCRDYVRERLGMPAFEPGRRGSGSVRPARIGQPADQFGEDRDLKRVERTKRRAVARFNEAQDPRNTIVETYLASRNLSLPDELAGTVLRFHPARPWKDDETGELLKVPAMVAAMRDIRTDDLTAIHRTRLTPDGCKIGRKMMGKASGAAIKLDPDENVCLGLHVGEGLETCLAARQLGFRPVWALGSASAIAAFPVLSGIDALSILAEDDATGANARAIEACAERWLAAGREVLRIASLWGGDINDALNRGAA
jgi:putative DNA primase/helicase